ncbi:MAG TPA: hypothetical protein VFC44_27705 [Candidatus Saccharimonadales bacterium]|nr:hypothetical protein [Candidatus Saccharimonadales bacterium]
MNAPQEYPFEYFVHEAGHVVVAHWVGASECWVGFVLGSSEPFQTRSSIIGARARIRQSFGGLFAETLLADQDISVERLRNAYTDLINPGNNFRAPLSAKEEICLQHAKVDLDLTIDYAKTELGTDDHRKLTDFLMAEWAQTYGFVQLKKQLILEIANRLKVWYLGGLEAPLFDGIAAIATCQV